MIQRRYFLLGIGIIIFFLGSNHLSFAQTTDLTPTLYCLGSCPSEAISPTAAISISPIPTETTSEPSLSQQTTASITATPTIASPSATDKKQHPKKKKHIKNEGIISKLIKLIFKFFLALLNLLWHMLGGHTTMQPLPSSGTTTTTPSIEASPTGTSAVSESPTASLSITTAPTIIAISSAKPTASNTGAQGAKLTVVNGDQTYSQDNQVISNVDIHGKVTIKGKNITLKSAIVRGPNSSNCANGAVIEVQGTGAVIQDTEVVPSHPNACLDGVWASNATLTRVNIHGSVDGVKAESATTIQDSYIHDLSWFASDPNQGGGSTHNDGVQTLKGSNITLKHNTIDLSTTKDGNAAWQVTQDFGATSTLHVENNWLDGGGCTLNMSHKGGSSLKNIWILNNRFGHHQGFSNCTILISTQTVLTQNSGNVWDDTGAAIPKPQQHD